VLSPFPEPLGVLGLHVVPLTRVGKIDVYYTMVQRLTKRVRRFRRFRIKIVPTNKRPVLHAGRVGSSEGLSLFLRAAFTQRCVERYTLVSLKWPLKGY
jgi:hypothetical protein